MQQQRCLVWVRGELLSAHSAGTVTVQHGDYVRIAAPPFDEPLIPTHFAVRACQAGLTRRQLIHRFQRKGAHDDDLFSDIEAAQHSPQIALPNAAEDDEVQLHQIAPVSKMAPPASQNAADAIVTWKVDGDQHEPARFERSIPGTFHHHDEQAAAVPPSWTTAMHQAFTDHAAVEQDEEGPVGYVDA